MTKIKTFFPGIALCFLFSIPCWLLGKQFPIIGGPVFAILIGMVIAQFYVPSQTFQKGITYTSKKILQLAVILLGFGLNLMEIAHVGAISLPVILSTISTSLIVSFIFYKIAKIPTNTAVLVGVGSSICGGSAIAATALGSILGLSNEGFGLFAGTAVNDTSSVTAAAAAWDGMHLGANTLDYATIVKLTRTLAIIPITLVLALYRTKKAKKGENANTFSLKKVFPFFILFFILASIITTIASSMGIDTVVFAPFKELSKFFIIMAMFAIGLNTDIIRLIKTGGKPILLGFISLSMQHVLGIW